MQSSLFAVGVAVCLLLFCASTVRPQAVADQYWPTGGNAQCVNLTEAVALYPGVVLPPACVDYIIWDMVYVDNNTVIRNFLARVAMGGTWAAPACIVSNWRLWCSLMFRPCYEFAVPGSAGAPAGTTVAVGQYVCSDYCYISHADCYGSIVSSLEEQVGWTQALIDLVLSCDPVWDALYGTQLPGVPIFPNSTYSFNLTYNNVTWQESLPCYRGNENITIPIPAIECPTGLYYSNSLCYFNCPEPLIDSSQYDAITDMVSVMGWISILSAAFLALTFLMDPDRRKFPANLSVFFILCILCLSFTFCLGNMAGWHNVWCDDHDRPNYWGGPACTIQGIIFVYFSLASVLWWLVLSFNLLLMVTKVLPADVRFEWIPFFKGLNEPKGWLRWEMLWIGYHVFAWIPPFIPLIISLSAKRLGYSGHDVWCTITSGDPVSFYVDAAGDIKYTGGDPANIWNLILLTVPILTVVCVGICILVFVVIWGIWKTGWRFFVQQWRLFLFIVFFIWIYVFVFSFQIDLSVKANDQYQDYANYISCAFFKTATLQIGNPTAITYNCNNNNIKTEISFPLWFIVCFNEASQGFLLILLYGSSWRFFKIWYTLFTSPKSLLSSKFSTSDEGGGGGSSNFTFKVAGRKVGGGSSTAGVGGSTQSTHMMDEIGDSGNSSSSNSSGEEGEGTAMKIIDGKNSGDKDEKEEEDNDNDNNSNKSEEKAEEESAKSSEGESEKDGED